MAATSSALGSPIVGTDWLAQRLGRSDVVVLDASWYLPQAGRDAQAEYFAAHIPGARFFDLDRASDAANPLPHMLPSADAFARTMEALGVGDEAAVIVYDGSGVNLSAPRLWWMLKTFGHDAVAVLDGGFGKWRREGRPLEAGTVPIKAAHFSPRFRPEMVRQRHEVEALLSAPLAQLVDARSRERFAGTAPEPRPGLASGHIPGSRNLPYTDLIDPGTGLVLSPDVLRARFTASGVNPARPVVTSCGSGVTACCLALALDILGSRQYAVYDGSWSEWGGLPNAPIATGDPS